jgi:hypothetical protein
MARCHHCYGSKRAMLIGWMEGECPTCNGLGSLPAKPVLGDEKKLGKGDDLESDDLASAVSTAEPFTKLDESVRSIGNAVKNVARGTQRAKA